MLTKNETEHYIDRLLDEISTERHLRELAEVERDHLADTVEELEEVQDELVFAITEAQDTLRNKLFSHRERNALSVLDQVMVCMGFAEEIDELEQAEDMIEYSTKEPSEVAPRDDFSLVAPRDDFSFWLGSDK